LRAQYLIIAFLFTLLLVLFVVSVFYEFYQSKIPDIENINFRERAEKTAELT